MAKSPSDSAASGEDKSQAVQREISAEPAPVEVTPIEMGWEEWLGFPDLGIPAIKAKIDTGAKTSALHAISIRPEKGNARRVRFIIQPNPDDPHHLVECVAPVKDIREITSSNGIHEHRYVIETRIQVGDRPWPIELTLTNRELMSYKMLLGRSALQDVVVRPQVSLLQPILEFPQLAKPVREPVAAAVTNGRATHSKRIDAKTATERLELAILSREPDCYSTRRLLEAAISRGHSCRVIDTARCCISINPSHPDVLYGEHSLRGVDAVIPRIGASLTLFGMALLRQLELLGVYCVNGADAIGASRDKLHAHQIFCRDKVPMPVTGFAHSPKDTAALMESVGGAPMVLKLLQGSQGKGVVLAETRNAAESVIDAFRNLDANFLVQEFVADAAGCDVRCIVIGNRVVAAMRRTAESGEFRSNLHRGGKAERIVLSAEERTVAIRAARAMGLRIAGVDMLQTKDGPKVLEVNSSPGLQGIESATEIDVADRMIAFIERHIHIKPSSRSREALRVREPSGAQQNAGYVWQSQTPLVTEETKDAF
jgi:ribosomal protein S6--L-glutamate ligase